jgi:bifunctional non-homologous end joining protein LigD
VELAGSKLVGKFALVLMKGRGEGNWLLMKMKDSRQHDQGDILEEAPDSVKTGRSLEEIAAEVPTPPPCEVKE